MNALLSRILQVIAPRPGSAVSSSDTVSGDRETLVSIDSGTPDICFAHTLMIRGFDSAPHFIICWRITSQCAAVSTTPFPGASYA